MARTLSGSLPDLLDNLPGWDPDFENFNIPPSTDIPVVLDEVDSATGEVTRRVDWAHWGLVPAWKKRFEERPQPINARRETAATNGMFRRAFRHGHCIVPASGYYEWQVRADGSKQPYFIHGRDSAGLAMAGLYEDWRDADHPDAPPRRSVTILTREAAGRAAEVHDRMPVLLQPGAYVSWLASAFPSAAATEDFLEEESRRSIPLIDAYPVGTSVGNVRNNGPDLIRALSA